MAVIQENEGRAPEKVELVLKRVCKVEQPEEDIPKGSVVIALSCVNALQSSSFSQKRRKVDDLCASSKDGLKPCSSMERKDSSKPCSAMERKDLSKPCSAIEREDLWKPCSAMERKDSSKPCSAMERKDGLKPCSAMERKDGLKPCSAMERKDRLKPCSAMERAIEIQATLSPQFPSMIKGMLQSHVTRGFWLGLNSSFCAKHLPREDTMMVLEDEDGRCYPSKYLAPKAGLSAGWRGFSIAHKLLVGDVVVFHLVTPTKFKVYISRENRREDVEGAFDILKLNADTKKKLAVNRGFTKKETEDCESQLYIARDNQREEVEGAFNILKLNADRKKKLAVSRGFAKKETEDCESQLLLGLSSQEKNSTNDDSIKGSNSDQSEHDNGDLEFDLGDGIRFCESSIDFNEVKSFQHFGIQANGLVITCELSNHHRRKYYDLCCSRKCFLHQHLVDGLNVKLIAGIIMETVNIADAIQASKLTTSQDDFLAWKRTLQGFERMGMDVGFLISRLDKLISLTDKSKRSEEVRVERCSALDELSSLEGKTLELKKKVRQLDEEIMTLEIGGSQLEFMYQELARQIGRPQ